MQTTYIYVDILLGVNLIVNYFLLLGTRLLLRSKVRKLRVFFGALIGALFSLTIFLPDLHIVLSMAIKVIMCILVVMCSFGVKKIVKNTLVFLAVNFIYAGGIFAIWFFLTPQKIYMRNGAIYIDLSSLTLVILTVVIYLLIELVAYFIRPKSFEKSIYSVRIFFGGNQVEIKALADTGNNMSDGITGAPVMVAELKDLKCVLPSEVISELENKNNNEYILNINDSWKKRFRMVPYTTVGGKGIIPAFRSDKVEIYKNTTDKTKGLKKHDKKEKDSKSGSLEVNGVYIALTNGMISNGEYSGIFNPIILNE